MNINRLSKQIAAFAAGSILFFWMLGIAGKMDYQEAVINSIPNEAYSQIVKKVGNKASDIVKEYKKHQNYYDSLSF